MKRLALIAMLALTGCHKSLVPLNRDTPPATATTGQKEVIVAAGQSNMAGRTLGHNPAVGFQQDYPNYIVINCAVGGTRIGEWGVGGTYDAGCVNAVAGRHVAGVIWYQGEADAYLLTTNWDVQFAALVVGWRTRWGNVPVVYAQLATHDDAIYTAPMWDLIKQQQATLSIPNSLMVKTEDLPLQDEVHLTGAADEEVGHRMANAFRLLQKD